MYDVIIIGGGPAGVAAAVYTARKQLKTLLLTDTFGGQSVVSADIQNWIGEPHISGFDLAQKLEAHVKAYKDMVEVENELASIVSQTGENFEVKTQSGTSFEGKTVIVCSGARRRKLGIPGEDTLNGKGVVYCSTCDAPLFKDKRVAVVGGGNAGLEAVQDLFPYASEIYLLEYNDAVKGDPVTFENIKNNPKLKAVILNAETQEIAGDDFVKSIKYKDRKTAEVKELSVDGVFVEIGSTPNSEIVKDLVEIDDWGQVKIDSKHATTSRPGIYAAGDVTDDPYKQNNISMGDGVKAALAVYAYLLRRS